CASTCDFPDSRRSTDTPLDSQPGGVRVARDVQRPETIDITTDRPAQPDDPDGFHPEAHEPPRARPGAYCAGLVVLLVGLVVTIATLATRVTSIVQTVLLAI